jgi:murein DD-endopeptidase MepM/ murein hydrolase activator NlpD
VVAAAEGTVIGTPREPVYGNLVSLRHGNGVVTRYGHLAKIDPKVTLGARVGIGQQIGIEGSTGPAPDCTSTSRLR